MSVAKHIEITAESKKGFDDAVQVGITTASKTVKGIKSAWVKTSRSSSRRTRSRPTG